MAHYQNQYGATPQETDQFGNPIQHGTTGATGFGTATTGYGTANDPYTGGQQQQERGMMDKIKDKIPGTGGARRADDPYSSHAHTGTGTTGTGYGTANDPYTGRQQQHERGMMDKIKDKIPGTGGARRADDPYSSHAHTGTGTTGTGYGTTDAPYTGGEYPTGARTDHPTPYGGTTYTGGRQQEGIVDKIKDKIPGTGHRDEAYSSHTTSTTAPYGGTTGPYGGTTGEHHEKKGIMDKIKEKLPGGHH